MMLSERAMLIVSQLYLMVLSLVLSIAPRYYLIVFIAYFAVIIGLSSYVGRARFKAKYRPEEIKQSRVLLREEKAFELAMQDEELVGIFAKQTKSMLFMFLMFPIYIVLFRTVTANFPQWSESLANTLNGNKLLAGFIIWLVTFEIMYSISLLSRKLILRERVQIPTIPRSYEITAKGIILKGGFGRTIGFPLPDETKLNVNEARGYVEIVFPKGNPIRLYTKKPRRVYELLEKYALRSE